MLPPVLSAVNDAGLPAGTPCCCGLPTFVAANNAPFPDPVYVFPVGFGWGFGLEKARDAPYKAASLTLCCVSAVRCGAALCLFTELIEPSDNARSCARSKGAKCLRNCFTTLKPSRRTLQRTTGPNEWRIVSSQGQSAAQPFYQDSGEPRPRPPTRFRDPSSCMSRANAIAYISKLIATVACCD